MGPAMNVVSLWFMTKTRAWFLMTFRAVVMT
jgi:hypothetical protein